MAEVKIQAETKHPALEGIALFGRGSDMLAFKIYRRVFNKDINRPWYAQDFIDLASYQTIRKVMAQLERKGYVKKIKHGYPIFWERIR